MKRLKLSDEELQVINWAETTDGEDSHRVMQVKIRRLAVLIKRMLVILRDDNLLDE